MQDKRVRQMRPPQPAGFGVKAERLQQLEDEAYAKKIAQFKANKAFNAAGLDKARGGKKGASGGGAAGPNG